MGESSKAATNRRWVSTTPYREHYDRIFQRPAPEQLAEAERVIDAMDGENRSALAAAFGIPERFLFREGATSGAAENQKIAAGSHAGSGNEECRAQSGGADAVEGVDSDVPGVQAEV